jgi:hypothetical protein
MEESETMRAFVFLRTGALALGLAVAGVSFSGCDEEEPKTTPGDGGAVDAPVVDSGADKPVTDAVTSDAPKEAGTDATTDGKADGGTDAVLPDGGTDAVVPDGGTDAESPDTGADTGTD